LAIAAIRTEMGILFKMEIRAIFQKLAIHRLTAWSLEDMGKGCHVFLIVPFAAKRPIWTRPQHVRIKDSIWVS